MQIHDRKNGKVAIYQVNRRCRAIFPAPGQPFFRTIFPGTARNLAPFSNIVFSPFRSRFRLFRFVRSVENRCRLFPRGKTPYFIGMCVFSWHRKLSAGLNCLPGYFHTRLFLTYGPVLSTSFVRASQTYVHNGREMCSLYSRILSHTVHHQNILFHPRIHVW